MDLGKPKGTAQWIACTHGDPLLETNGKYILGLTGAFIPQARVEACDVRTKPGGRGSLRNKKGSVLLGPQAQRGGREICPNLPHEGRASKAPARDQLPANPAPRLPTPLRR